LLGEFPRQRGRPFRESAPSLISVQVDEIFNLILREKWRKVQRSKPPKKIKLRWAGDSEALVLAACEQEKERQERWFRRWFSPSEIEDIDSSNLTKDVQQLARRWSRSRYPTRSKRAIWKYYKLMRCGNHRFSPSDAVRERHKRLLQSGYARTEGAVLEAYARLCAQCSNEIEALVKRFLETPGSLMRVPIETSLRLQEIERALGDAKPSEVAHFEAEIRELIANALSTVPVSKDVI
jgi:hypothetical protein